MHIKIVQWAQINCIYLPLYVAIEEGYFSQCGIDVELLPTGNDDEIYKAVVKGEADFGLGDPVFCAVAHGKNTSPRARVVANICNRVALWGITNNPVIRPITTKENLAGLRIGCYPAPSTSYALLCHTKQTHKRMLKSMKIIEAPIGQQLELLMTDQADIALYIEPFISVAESRGWRVVYNPSQLYDEFAFSGLYCSIQFIEKYPDIIDKVIHAIGKALLTLHQNPEIGARTAGRLFPDIKKSVLEMVVKRCLADKIWSQSPDIPFLAWQKAVEVKQFSEMKLIDNNLMAIYTKNERA